MEFRVHKTQLTIGCVRHLAFAAGLGRRERATQAPLDSGDEGRCAQRPTGPDMLAQHVELPARRVVVEEAAPVGDQMVEAASLDEAVLGDAEMGASARPGPVLRPGGQPRPLRVALDIAQGRKRMRLVHGARAETTLPEIATPTLAPIDGDAVAPVSVGNRLRHAHAARRHEDQMNVVGHQAPRPDGDPAGPAMLAEELDVEPVIVVAEEHQLAPVATLGDVVRDVGHDRPRKLGHGGSLSTADRH